MAKNKKLLKGALLSAYGYNAIKDGSFLETMKIAGTAVGLCYFNVY